MSSISSIDFGLLPAGLLELCRRLRQAGFEAYVVGGSVRDLLLQRSVHDWDVATSARPEAVQRLFSRTVPTGIKHGTVTVLLRDLEVQVTTYRGESGYGDARHPDQVTFLDSIDADLSRRDFTINAMALDTIGHSLVDPFGGSEDLQLKLVRAVGDAGARFGEDGLRTMRAVRLAAVLEFQIEPNTLAAIPGALPQFRMISAERVRDELLKLLCAPRPSIGIELMRSTGLLNEVLPELMAGRGLVQNCCHVDDVYQHSLEVCDRVPAADILRLAALLHDIGKPVTATPHPTRAGENSFCRHAQEGAVICETVARRLRLSNEQRERLCRLVYHHMIEPRDVSSGPALRRFLHRVGDRELDELFELRAADLASRAQAAERLAELQELRARVESLRRQRVPLQVGDLAIGGREVMERLGVGAGPQIGVMLRELLERVLDEPSLNERDKLLTLVDELAGSQTDKR